MQHWAAHLQQMLAAEPRWEHHLTVLFKAADARVHKQERLQQRMLAATPLPHLAL